VLVEESKLLDAEGLRGLYDFIYVPIDLASRASFGYAFVNASSHGAALKFMAQLDGATSSCGEPLSTCWSEPHQGLEVHIARYRNSPLLHHTVPDDVQPMVFCDGVRQPFPEPTKNIKAPRISLRRRARHLCPEQE